METKQIKSAKDLKVYQKAYGLAMEIFNISKTWPGEEKFSLIDQIRRSSRSVCANLREAWSKRRYEAHFISKLTDADGENSETDTWLDFARDCGYLATCDHRRLARECRQVGAMIGSMLNNPGPFLIKNIRHPTSDLRHLETNGLKGARKK
ncbi:MAG TPA: four helix bundle protein [Desulfobacteraceae bacterium]|nr:four helix bundle protein [Desulfobacteraceae bacterium]